jgi:hypothetical protein
LLKLRWAQLLLKLLNRFVTLLLIAHIYRF